MVLPKTVKEAHILAYRAGRFEEIPPAALDEIQRREAERLAKEKPPEVCRVGLEENSEHDSKQHSKRNSK